MKWLDWLEEAWVQLWIVVFSLIFLAFYGLVILGSALGVIHSLFG